MSRQKLQKITLFGFKSFADKTTLHFERPIVAIVGPNGCGKSNISDAFRWTIGEQSAKLLRGEKMEDVIFFGTGKRGKQNVAECTIVIETEKEHLPSELAITRRVHRSGEMEYLVGGKQARLMDIQEILLDLGMGKSAFSLFEQGKIDQIVSASPKERKLVFEEASGITRFLKKKKEAMRRLEETGQNLLRVQDILLEVKKNVETLEKQATLAGEYKEKKELLLSLERSLLRQAYLSLQEKEAEQHSKFACKKALEKTIEEALLEQESVLEKIKQKTKSANEKLQDKKTQLQQKSLELASLRAEKNHKERTIEELKGKRSQREEEKTLLEQGEKEVLESLARLEKSAQISREELNRHVALVAERKRAEREEEEKAKEAEKIFEKMQKEYASSLERRHMLEKKHQSASFELAELTKKETEQKERLLFLENKGHSCQKELLDLKKSHALSLKEVEKLKEEQKEQKEQIESFLKEQEKIEEVFKQSYSELEKLKARVDALFSLKEEMSGLSKGASALLVESKKEKSPLYRKLEGLFEKVRLTESDVESAKNLLRRYGKTVVAKNKEALLSALQCAKEQDIHDFSLVLEPPTTFLPDHPHKDSLSHHPLSSLVLKDVLYLESVFEAIDHLSEDRSFSYVTKDGFIIDEKGFIFCLKEKAQSIFEREKELEDLSILREKKENLIKEQKEMLHSLKTTLETMRKEEHEKKKTLDSLKETLYKQEFSLSILQKQLEETAFEKEKITSFLMSATEAKETLTKSVSAFGSSLKELEESIQNEKSILEEAKKEKESARCSLDVSRKALFEAVAKEQAAKEAVLQKEHDKALDQRKKEEMQRRREALLRREKEQEETLEELLLKQESLKELLDEKVSEERELKDALSNLANNLSSQQEELEQAQNSYFSKKEERTQLERTLIELEGERKLLEHERRSLEEKAEEVLKGETLASLGDEKLPPSDALKASRRVKEIQKELSMFGSINMSSIDDLKEQKERALFLEEQLQDMEVSKEELLKIIESLDLQSQEQYLSVFEKIREHFKNTFSILFQGGEADLLLTGPGSSLDQEIEIQARPPGKQMRSLSLLSGGEKCLTSIALLFAIFEVRPSPFCILDEIDAPLDDANVDRFVQLLKTYEDRCQFVIITHNKKTMSIADKIYGVSMPEKGVSTVLSAQFEKEEKELELVEV